MVQNGKWEWGQDCVKRLRGETYKALTFYLPETGKEFGGKDHLKAKTIEVSFLGLKYGVEKNPKIHSVTKIIWIEESF